jgi:membrane-associated protease RseP (regulator of RpoE activity)
MNKTFVFLTMLAVLCVNAIAQNQESFGGTGMSVRVGKQGVSVIGIIPNSPAYNAGLQAGDIIISADGTTLSSVQPEKQVALLRGKEGTIANLVVDRNGKQIAISAKRTEIAVQPLESETIANWYGKKENLSTEEISFLASQKTADGYEALGVVQNGLPLASGAENLNAKAIQQISVKKAEENSLESENISKQQPFLNFVSRKEISISLSEVRTGAAKLYVLNAKGEIVWHKSFLQPSVVN